MKRPVLRVALCVVAASLGTLAVRPASATGTVSYTVSTIHLAVAVGPNHDQPCDIVADLYQPAGADSSHPVAAIMMTNGFGGSKDTEAPMAKFFAGLGYGVLDYSGLGFGGSSCTVHFGDPAYDGAAASQLVGFLGGDQGISFTDAAHTTPFLAPDWIIKDSHDHAGVARTDDPRVGVFGISYGGGTALSAASVDPRIDAIVPVATWNDLSYSLFPNNADLVHGVTTSTPGVAKTSFGGLFDLYFGASTVTCNLTSAGPQPGCSAFDAALTASIATQGAQGYPTPGFEQQLRDASTTTFGSRITVPTLLIQAQHDTLFNLNEAIATYQQLRAQGTVVSMVWTSGGHTGAPLAGDYDFAAPALNQYPIARAAGWFSHYLLGVGDAGPGFAYLRDWLVPTVGAWDSYATAPSYPVGSTRTWYLGWWQNLVDSQSAVGSDVQAFLTGPDAQPLGITPLDSLELFGFHSLFPNIDLPGTYARWATPLLGQAVHVAGQPVVTVRIHSVVDADAPLADKVVLYAKLLDVAPNGTKSLINIQVAPVRIGDPSQLVHIVLPAVVHDFEVGHRIEIDLTGSDLNYHGSSVDQIVSVNTSDPGQTFSLPIVP